jgi:hypothetical protein
MLKDKDLLKSLEPELDMLRVRAASDGDYIVNVTYRGETPSAYIRQAIAIEIAEILHRRIGDLRSKRRAPTVTAGDSNG